jgi:hypothetical protein
MAVPGIWTPIDGQIDSRRDAEAQRKAGLNHIPNSASLRLRVRNTNSTLRLEKSLGMSAGFWMDLQLRWDLYHAHEQDQKDLESISPCTAAIPH